MNFEQIRGQESVISTLKKFIKSGRVPQAMIFHGPAGVGKSSSALAFARALNCTNLDENQNPCGLCQNCKQIEAHTHPDVIFADFAYQAALRGEEVEKQQTLRIETVRSLTASSQQKVAFGKWKVFIIDCAEKLVLEASNALLKFIEEPPQNTLWILVSSKREVMLSTIKSRCQSIAFAPLKEDIIISILKDNFIEDSIAQKAAFYGEGSSSKALIASHILEDFSTLPQNSAFAMAVSLNLPRVLATARLQASNILDILAICAHKNWLLQKGEAQKESLTKLLSKIVFYKRGLSRNVSPQLILQAALVSAEVSGIKLQEIL